MRGYEGLLDRGVAVLSLADLITCLLVMFSGIAKGVGADSLWWQLFDVYLHLGGGAVSTTASIITTVMVAVERLINIRYPITVINDKSSISLTLLSLRTIHYFQRKMSFKVSGVPPPRP